MTLRPAALSQTFVILAAVCGAFVVISRTTGSGWLVVVISVLLGVVALSVFLPLFGLLQLRVAARTPSDATAGRSMTVTISISGRGRGVTLQFLDPPGEMVRVDGAGGGQASVVPPRRGVTHTLEVELRSAVPLGLVSWRRRAHLHLPAPLYVGPSPIDVPLRPSLGEASAGERAEAPGILKADLVRSVREYLSADPMGLVSWAATARHGRLMVKELEASTAPQLLLVVDLRGDEADAELAASRAAGLAAAGLREGIPVVMATCQPEGGLVAPVRSNVDTSRRLARAVPGAPPERLPRPGEVVLRVTAGEDRGGAERR